MILTIRTIRVAVETVVSALAPPTESAGQSPERPDAEDRKPRDDRG